MKRKIAIIGSGLGGLVTGYLLAKQGEQVIIFEHDKCPGGCMQSFYRDGIRFDTGFHFVGGLKKGGPLYRFFKELDLLSLPWKSLEGQEIWIGNNCYILPTGPQKWLKYLIDKFPHQENNLRNYLNLCQEIGECSHLDTKSYWGKNAWDWLCETIDDSLLRDVLSGSSLMLELNKKTLSLYEYAEIMYSYIYSSHRLADGGQLIINRLLEYIKLSGGKLYCASTVTRILEDEGKVIGVQLQNGAMISADVVLSAIHPVETMNLLSEQTRMRKIYRQRLGTLKDSLGCFTGNIKLKDNKLNMREMPIYVHREKSDLWDYNSSSVDHILIHFYPEQNALDIITPMSWNLVEKWDNTSVGRRNDEYEHFKAEILRQCLELAETAVPNIKNAIEQVWTSTPLTWKKYLLAHNGTAYGVCKDCNAPETTLLLPRTPLRGLYLTGQSLILHGIMGTTISGFLTAESIKQ